MNKELIKKRFSKNLKNYSQNAVIQKKMAEKLVSFLDKNDYENILEIGCGTGLLTEIVNKKLNYKSYIANDIVSDCRDYILRINPDIRFFEGDIEESLRENNKKYDLIISNASLQWVGDFEIVVITLLSRLSDNGILLFSTFGNENFREMFFTFGKALRYYSVSEIKEMFSSFEPKVEEEIHIMSFKTPMDVLKHLRMTGVNSLEVTSWTKKDVKEFENTYNNLCAGKPTLTYNPIYVMLRNK